MEVKVQTKFIRMSEKKVRLVADLVRGMAVDKAIAQLTFTNKVATKPMIKTIKSAIANAENNFNLEKGNLFIKEVKIDEGPVLKRWMPRAHGRATPLRKKSCHINLVLAEIKEGIKRAKKEVDKSNKTEEKDEAIALKEEKKSTAKAATPKVSKAKASDKGFTSRVFRRKAG